MSRWPCKDNLRGTCNNSFCEKWHPPECLFYKTKSGCRFGEKCSYAHRQVDASLGMTFPADPHQLNSNAPKFKDRSQEETEWQER